MSDDTPISHLQRRKIEGRVLIPFIEACRTEFGDDATKKVVTATIRGLAAKDGADWASAFGTDMSSLRRVAEELWAGGGSLDVDIVSQTDETLSFNVTRCKYAEFYKNLGLADIGYLVHCNRDHAMIVGFNTAIELERSQTIMQGAPCYDFRFRNKS